MFINICSSTLSDCVSGILAWLPLAPQRCDFCGKNTNEMHRRQVKDRQGLLQNHVRPSQGWKEAMIDCQCGNGSPLEGSKRVCSGAKQELTIAHEHRCKLFQAPQSTWQQFQEDLQLTKQKKVINQSTFKLEWSVKTIIRGIGEMVRVKEEHRKNIGSATDQRFMWR